MSEFHIDEHLVKSFSSGNTKVPTVTDAVYKPRPILHKIHYAVEVP